MILRRGCLQHTPAEVSWRGVVGGVEGGSREEGREGGIPEVFGTPRWVVNLVLMWEHHMDSFRNVHQDRLDELEALPISKLMFLNGVELAS